MTTVMGSALGKAAFRFTPLALVGVLALVPTLLATLKPLLARVPDAPPLGVVVAAQAGQVLVLTVLAVLLGAWAAPRVGFRSRILDRDWTGFGPDAAVAAAGGAVVGAVIIGTDHLVSPLLGPEWAQAQAGQPPSFGATLAGMLYGGINEELIVRWGLMSLFTYLFWRTVARRFVRPPRAAVLAAVVAAAVAFGVLHLGGVAAVAPLTPLLVARTVGLNAVGGVVFGLLFTRRSLEAAMLAHATAHVAMAVLVLVV